MPHIKVTAMLTALPAKADALRDLLSGLLGPSRGENGNLRYDLWQDQADRGRFYLDELYVDQRAVEAHRASPHFQHYLSRIGQLAERTAWTLEPIDVVTADP